MKNVNNSQDKRDLHTIRKY